MKTKTNSTSLAALITESERTLAAAIKHFDLKIAPGVIMLTIQTAGRRKALGWFWSERWQPSNGKAKPIHEINLSAEHLAAHNKAQSALFPFGRYDR